jgi:uncharacterized tellurite resistance protein B-like protein
MQPPQAPSTLLWAGKDVTLVFGASRLTGLLTYVVQGVDLGTEPSAIVPRLAAASEPHFPSERELPYWPRFADLTASQRRYYLDWLAGGRTSAPAEAGYAFLFFYGLERRALLDCEDIAVVFDEVVRMRKAFDGPAGQFNRSFTRYTTEFLWFLLNRDSKAFTPKQFRAAFKLSLSARTDDWLAAATAWLCGRGYPLPEWLAFEIASRLPKSKRSVVAKRIGEELKEVFQKRYTERFGKGLNLKAGKAVRCIEYRPASAALAPCKVPVHGPMNLMSQFNPLSELWNDCIDDLRRLSTFAGHDDGMTVERWRAMPPDLRANVDHPLTDRFAEFIAARAGESGDTLVLPRELATLMGVSESKKLSPAVARKVAETVEDVGYCVEPDARVSGRGYDDQSPVTLYLNMIQTPIDPSRYRAVSALLEVCIAIAAADGDVDEAELTKLARRIDEVFVFNEAEHRRLDALRALRVAKRGATTDACRSVKQLERSQRELIGRLMVAVVGGDGAVTATQIKAIRKVYGAIGFEKPEVDKLVAGMVPTDDLTTVVAAVSGPAGEKLPPPPGILPAPLTFDRLAIAAKLAETREVARLLAEAMNADVDEEDNTAVTVEFTAPPPAEVIAPAAPAMPTTIAEFYREVISKPAWTRDELSAAARSRGLMLAGAIETVNDWSTEQYGGPLLYEDGDLITLESAYIS